MVQWASCFIVNPDPADNKAILNSEPTLLDPESKELFLKAVPPNYKPVLSLNGSATRLALEGRDIQADLRASCPTINRY